MIAGLAAEEAILHDVEAALATTQETREFFLRVATAACSLRHGRLSRREDEQRLLNFFIFFTRPPF